MEGHHDSWSTYLSCVYHVRGDITPQTALPLVFYSLSIEPKMFIIIHSSLDYYALGQGQAQYIIWALDPTLPYFNIF